MCQPLTSLCLPAPRTWHAKKGAMDMRARVWISPANQGLAWVMYLLQLRVPNVIRKCLRIPETCPLLSTLLPMGAKSGKVTCCGLWVQRSNPGCYSLFEQSSGVGSREARLPPINGWQVRDKRLTAYTLTLLDFLPPPQPVAFLLSY